MNIEKIAEYRASRDAAEGVRLANDLREAFRECLDRGEIDQVRYLELCAPLDEIREYAGVDPRVHERKADRILNGLVAANDKLTLKITKRVLGSRSLVEANVDEAHNEGRMGLVRAIESYSEERGKFSTWAGFWIRHYVQTCMHKQVDFAKQRPACMPASVAKQVNKFRLQHGREPEPQELGVEPATWARWAEQVIAVSVEDMQTPWDGDDRRGIGSEELVVDERTHPDAVVQGVHFQEKLANAMAEMSPRNRDMTRALFIDGRTLPDIADEFGVSFQRVHQIKVELEKRLRKLLAA